MDKIIKRIQLNATWILIATLIVTVISGLGILNLKLNTNIRAYIDDSGPHAKAFQTLENTFNTQENIVVVFNRPDHAAFTVNDIQNMHRISEKLWETPHSRRVESPTTYPIPRNVDNTLESTPAFDTAEEINQKSLKEFKQLVNESTLIQRLISPQLDVANIVLHLNIDESVPSQAVEAVTFVKQVLASELKDSEMEANLMGTVLINESVKEAIFGDAIWLLPTTTTVIVIVLFLVLRVVSGVIIATTLLSLTNIITVGFFGWLGVEVTPGAGAIPTMITIIAIADSIHFLSTYYHELATGKDKPSAIANTFRINFIPILVTSITTAIGLLCLNFSDSPPYRAMGNIVAVGSLVALVLTLTFIPAILHVLPAPKKVALNTNVKLFDFAKGFGRFVVNNNKVLFLIFGAVAVLLVSQIGKNQLNDNWEDYFDETFEIKRGVTIQEKYFIGAHFAEYVLVTDKENGVLDQKTVKDLYALPNWLRQQPEVRYVVSFADILQAVNHTLNNGDSSLSDLSNEALSQLSLIYEMSLPYGFDTNEILSLDKSQTKISVFLGSLHSDELLAFDQRVSHWIKNNTNLNVRPGSGIDLIFAHMSDTNIKSIALGTIFGLVLISLIMIFTLKSLKLGLISLVPNLLPIGMAYGLWGITMSHIDMAISIVGAMSLGLVVDDSVHFLSKYRYARDQLFYDCKNAIVYAFSTVGFAMLVTSVILCAGFALMIGSHFDPTWTMGSLLMITILFALVADMLILPAILIALDKQPAKEPQQNIQKSLQRSN